MSNLSVNEAMKLIKALDAMAMIDLNCYDQWYVSARVEVKQGISLTNDGPYCATPGEAVIQYLEYLQNLPVNRTIVLDASSPSRRELRWDGQRFADVR